MQIKTLTINDFIKNTKDEKITTFDVRSEGEYAKAHFPGSINLPLLNNEYRAIIGTIYKKEGREAAVKKGFELVGPSFHQKIEEANNLSATKLVQLYCWRGGMRSNIMAWLLQMAGFKVNILEGGYKRYRNWCLEQLCSDRNFLVLDGKTGSGKTEILSLLKSNGEQVIDLEGLANHRGSSFGGIGMGAQPSQEYFENLLAIELNNTNVNSPIWLENESRAIGILNIPQPFFVIMKSKRTVEVDVDEITRCNRILIDYGNLPKEELIEATSRLTKRMGGQHVKAAIEYLNEGDKVAWCNLLLNYYDKSYQHAKDTKGQIFRDKLKFDWNNKTESIKKLLEFSK